METLKSCEFGPRIYRLSDLINLRNDELSETLKCVSRKNLEKLYRESCDEREQFPGSRRRVLLAEMEARDKNLGEIENSNPCIICTKIQRQASIIIG